jgi:glycosyltransferase involved in cell wall biosynthesis
MKRFLLATDAWFPQVNGVVRTWETTLKQFHKRGIETFVIHPQLFRGFPTPFYPEIRLACVGSSAITQYVADFQPDAIHIATEGPIGLATRFHCTRNRYRFSTSYHTKFPEYLYQFLRIPTSWSYGYLRWFHRGASATCVATPSLEKELIAQRFTNLKRWSRGVDLDLFQPGIGPFRLPKPVLLYVGRVSIEKGIEDFLKLDIAGTKVIVGDGPARASLEKKYPQAVFLGYRKGKQLAEVYQSADVFVFPSKTDTFGLVMIEALACGVPVAAYPVVGPIDIITEPKIGVLHNNLHEAIQQTLATADRNACIEHGRKFTWERCTEQLLQSLVPIKS